MFMQSLIMVAVMLRAGHPAPGAHMVVGELLAAGRVGRPGRQDQKPKIRECSNAPLISIEVISKKKQICIRRVFDLAYVP